MSNQKPETGNLKPAVDLSSAAAFLAALAGPGAPAHFQTFDDSPEKRRDLAWCAFGSFDQHRRRLVYLNDRGAGVFVTVNRTDGRARQIGNITGLRALFVDGDGADRREWHLQPNIVVRRGTPEMKRWHAYWLLSPGEDLARFHAAQLALALHYGTDPIVHDLPRVMRIPGFIHRKAEPLSVSLESGVASPDSKRTIDAILLPLARAGEAAADVLARAVAEYEKLKEEKRSKNPPHSSVAGGGGKAAPIAPPPPATNKRGELTEFDRAKLWTAKYEGAGEGKRNKSIYDLAFSIISHFKVSESDIVALCLEGNLRNSPPLAENEVRQSVRSAINGAKRAGCVGNKWEPLKTGNSNARPIAEPEGFEETEFDLPDNESGSVSLLACPAVPKKLPDMEDEKRAAEGRAQRARDWLDTEFDVKLMQTAAKLGSERVAAVGELFREMAINLAGCEAAAVALIRDKVCNSLKELKKADYERCLREAKAWLKSSKATSANDDGDSSDWGGLARKFLNMLGDDKTIIRWRQYWYFWTKARGCYSKRENEWMQTWATNWMDSQGMAIGKTSVANFINAILAAVFVEDGVTPPCWLCNGEGRNGVYVAMKNGILDLESCVFEMGDTMRHAPLIEHTPDWFTLNALPYEFRPDAQCPGLEKALEQWQPRAAERDPDGLGVRLLQDFAGYIFEPGQPQQVMLLNYGPGNDGKSQYKDLLIALAGVENTTTLGLEALDPSDPNAREDLLDKTLWTIPDANQLDKMGEGSLKAITGGDRVNIGRKFRLPVNGVISAKIVMACNNLPGFTDRSEGIWRRLLMLHWEPIRGEIIRDFASKLIRDEMPGIFRWALQGWKRVREVGFSRRGIIVDNVQKFRRETQHEFAFMDQHVEILTGPDETDSVSVSQLIAAYKKWCVENNVKPFVHPETMGRALAKWVRWALERADPPWTAEAITEFLHPRNFKKKINEPGKPRRDCYVKIKILKDDEDLPSLHGYTRWRTERAPPAPLLRE